MTDETTLHGKAAVEAYRAAVPGDTSDDLSVEELEVFEFNTTPIPVSIVRLDRLLVAAGLAGSNSSAQRLLKQGAVSIEGERLTDAQTVLRTDQPTVIRCGKRQTLVRMVKADVL